MPAVQQVHFLLEGLWVVTLLLLISITYFLPIMLLSMLIQVAQEDLELLV